VVDADNWMLYEMFDAHPVNGGASWTGGSGAIFDMTAGTVRPAGWTSADAAGLPIFPGLVRYDEVGIRHAIEHALRFSCSRTRKAYIPPARHSAGSQTSVNFPPMGMRVRLKAYFDISDFSPTNQVILRALKKYGMFVADNGTDMFLSGAPDPRWNDDACTTSRTCTEATSRSCRCRGLSRSLSASWPIMDASSAMASAYGSGCHVFPSAFT
jgi:hypothetical protein